MNLIRRNLSHGAICTISLLILLLTFLLAETFVQAMSPKTQQNRLRNVTISSTDVIAATAESPYKIDLRRRGIIYTFDRDVDISKVSVKTPRGVRKLSELTASNRKKISGPLTVAQTADMRILKRMRPRNGRPQLDFQCSGFACTCQGIEDCSDMFFSDVCGPIAICTPDDDCVCIRLG